MLRKVSLILIVTLGIAQSAISQNIDFSTIMQKGKDSYEAGNYQSAVKWFKQAYKFDKKSPEAIYYLSLSCFESGDYNNAAFYSGKLILKRSEYEQEAYIIHGNSWDKQLRRKRAQKIYREGMDKFPDNYLMHYNLANSLFREKELKKAEEELIMVIEKDPTYAPAHLLLSYVAYDQGERVKAMLPLYYYLVINQDDDRSEGVYNYLQTLWEQGARAKGQRDAKVYKAGVDKGDFARVEADLLNYENQTQSQIKKYNSRNNVSLINFADNTAVLFETLSKSMGGNFGFWWEFYASFFHKVHSNNYSESLSYYVSSCKYNEDVLMWLSGNHLLFQEFVVWMELQ